MTTDRYYNLEITEDDVKRFTDKDYNLRIAILKDDAKYIQWVLDHNVFNFYTQDIVLRNDRGNVHISILRFAVMKGSINIVKFLIDNKIFSVDSIEQGNSRESILELAIESKQHEIVKYLVSRNVYVPYGCVLWVMRYAIEHNVLPLVKQII